MDILHGYRPFEGPPSALHCRLAVALSSGAGHRDYGALAAGLFSLGAGKGR